MFRCLLCVVPCWSLQAYCVCWASLDLGVCMYGCPSLYEGIPMSGSTAHLYLSIDFELYFWSMKRTLCSTSVSLSLHLSGRWTSAAADKHRKFKYQCFCLLQINLCYSQRVQVCVQVRVCLCYSDELGERRLAKSGCHANSVSWLHNTMQQGDGLNLTLLNLTLDTPSLTHSTFYHICGCTGQRIKPINQFCAFWASSVASSTM